MFDNVSQKYSAAFLIFWQRYGRSTTLDQCARLTIEHNPGCEAYIYRPFDVSFYAAPRRRCERRVRVDPNLTNGFQRLLWDVRRALGDGWKQLRDGVRLLVGHTHLTPENYISELFAAPHALVVEADVNGHAWPSADPLAAELEERRAAAEARRAAEAAARARSERNRGHSIAAVLDAVANDYAKRMTTLTEKANKQNATAELNVISEPNVARVTAMCALCNPANYADSGYPSAEEFFTKGLGAPKASEAIDALAQSIGTKTSRSQPTMRSTRASGLSELYRASAINSSLVSQWRKTINSAFGRDRMAPSAVEYRVQPDYGLAVVVSPDNSYAAAPRHGRHTEIIRSPQAEERARNGLAPFHEFALGESSYTKMARQSTWTRDTLLLRGAAKAAVPQEQPVQAAVAEFVGASLTGDGLPQVPSLELIASSASLPPVPSLEPVMAEPEVAEPPPPAKIEPVSNQAYPIYASMSNVAMLPMKSLNDDPLALEMARELLADPHEYAALFVPDEQIFPADQRAAAAEQMRALAPGPRAELVRAHMLRRSDTNNLVQALISGEHVPETGLLAANTDRGVWRVSADANGTLHVFDFTKKQRVPMQAYRMQEHSPAVVFSTPVLYKSAHRVVATK